MERKWLNLPIPEKIETVLAWAGLERKQLAALLGVSIPTVTSWIKGNTRPQKEHLKKIDALLLECLKTEPACERSWKQQLPELLEYFGTAEMLAAAFGDMKAQTVTNWFEKGVEPQPRNKYRIDKLYRATCRLPRRKQLQVYQPPKREKIVIPWTTRR